ncbi:carbohydrate ABC transporter permease [Vallitalea guaymasensis]|uniref:Sugar ABC transporter permease n=1 Tax=Vallitalea guaymasensis TaxID=1185412 RepID=A0A8J8SC63_9FIRM|nr:sugar ABC transporter permease [Vallitalea guaymasensis]QUH29407.1 sugar ABC transporter permease [Vallitalea guaymasensis]
MGTSKKSSRQRWFFIFILPSLFLFTISIIIPVIQGFILTLTNWDGIQKSYDFVGFKNYITLFQDELFYNALLNTLKFTLGVAIFQNVFGLLLAVLLNKSSRVNNFFRTIFFMPAVLSVVLAGFIWTYVYSDGIPALYDMLNLKFTSSPLGNPDMAMIALIIIQLWLCTGTTMVIYIAGLQSIPEDIYESAKVDGANHLQSFFKITLPMLGPAITINFVLVVKQAMMVFDLVFVTTSGGPGHCTDVLSTYLWETTFTNNQAGYGSSMSFIFLLILIIMAMLQLKFFRKREVEM